MLKNLLMMALLGVATASVSVEACAKGTKVVNAPSKTTASSITCQMANQTVNVEFYSPLLFVSSSRLLLMPPNRRKAIRSF